MKITFTVRHVHCPFPRCEVFLPLRDDRNYLVDYNVIAEHSDRHEPPVTGAWLECDETGMIDHAAARCLGGRPRARRL